MPDSATVEQLTKALETTSASFKELDEKSSQIEKKLGELEKKFVNEDTSEMKATLAELKKQQEEACGTLTTLMEAGADKYDERITKLASDNDALQKQLREGLELVKSQKAAESIPGFDDSKEARDKFSLLKYAVACAKANRPGANPDLVWKNAGYERDVMIELARKPEFVKAYDAENFGTYPEGDDFSKAPVARGISDATGQVLFPISVSADLISLFFEMSVINSLGCTMIGDLGRARRHQIPRLSTVTGGAVVNENGTIALGDNTFDHVELFPYKVAGMWEMTNESLESITPMQEARFRSAIMEQIRTTFEKLMFNGVAASGSAPKLDSLVESIPSANKTTRATTNASDKNLNDIIEQMVYLVDPLDDNNISEMPGNRYLMARRLWRRLLLSTWIAGAKEGGNAAEKPADVQDRPYKFGNAIIDQGTIESLLGYPIVKSNYVSTKEDQGTEVGKATTVYFGHWPDYYCAMWRNMRVGENPYLADAWKKDALNIRVLVEGSFANGRPDGFTARTGLGVRP